MRDFFSVLLQVSFAAKSCEDDLQACLECWMPLLRAVRQRTGNSLSSAISDTLLHRLQIMDDLEFSEEELDAMELPSKNDEMGSSLIESKLDDHTLAHCFSFLSVKDVCTGIERSSHRFLQVSRNAHFHFFQECAEWNSERSRLLDYGRWHSPLDRLLHSHPNIPDSIALRNLHRFKIGRLKYDPVHSIDNSHSHRQLKFQDVIRVIGRNVQSLHMWVYYDDNVERHHFFPEVLSHITDVEFGDEDAHQLQKLCSAFPKCRKLNICCNECHSFAPLNQLSELESLKFDCYRSECKTGELDPACFPNLTHVDTNAFLLVHFAPLFTPQIKSLDLESIMYSEIDPNCIGHLSGIHNLNLIGFHTCEQNKVIINQLRMPDRIPRVRIEVKNWESLECWVNRVDELEYVITHWAYPVRPSEQLIAALTDGWTVPTLLIQMTHLSQYDCMVLSGLMVHPNTQHSEITLELRKERWKNGFDEGIARLQPMVDERTNWTLKVTHK